MTEPTVTREALLVDHTAARRRRDAAPLGSTAYEAALEELAKIEVEIARIERAMTPPRV
jgi:hypothetical protein